MAEGSSASWRAPMPPFHVRLRMFAMVELVPLAGAVVGLCVVLRDGVWRFDIAVFAAMYVATMFGVELGMHRVIAHKQCEVARPLRALACIFGAMAGEGSPLLWSAIHRIHHGTSDDVDDPHSPVVARASTFARLRAFLWAQFLWYGEIPGILGFQRALSARLHGRERTANAQAEKFVDGVRDWLDDDVVVRCDRAYPLWIALGFAMPAALGFVTAGVDGAVHGLVWGGFVRHFAVKQVSFAINSIGHTVGVRSLSTGDHSRNNVVMSVLTLGSGWHNNHHAFPRAAILQFRWWQLDPSGFVIALCEKLGLASNVHRVDQAKLAAKRAAFASAADGAIDAHPAEPHVERA